MGTYTCTCVCAPGREQKKAWIPWYRGYRCLSAAMWVQGIKLWLSASAAGALNYWAISSHIVMTFEVQRKLQISYNILLLSLLLYILWLLLATMSQVQFLPVVRGLVNLWFLWHISQFWFWSQSNGGHYLCAQLGTVLHMSVILGLKKLRIKFQASLDHIRKFYRTKFRGKKCTLNRTAFWENQIEVIIRKHQLTKMVAMMANSKHHSWTSYLTRELCQEIIITTSHLKNIFGLKYDQIPSLFSLPFHHAPRSSHFQTNSLVLLLFYIFTYIYNLLNQLSLFVYTLVLGWLLG